MSGGVVEGWLQKRGIIAGQEWQRRWCVLYPGSVEFFEDPSRSRRRGGLKLGPRSRTMTFRTLRELGDSADLPTRRPFGFLVESDPNFSTEFVDAIDCWATGASKGKGAALGGLIQTTKQCEATTPTTTTKATNLKGNVGAEGDEEGSRVYYFQTSSQEEADRWTIALSAAVDDISRFNPGDVGVFITTCQSDSKDGVTLPVGSSARVVHVDEKGDLVLKVAGIEAPQWLFRDRHARLQKAVERGVKDVFLEIVPQSQFVNHWALRVGRGPASWCYEFESDGVRIGRSTALDKGYEGEIVRLKGFSTRLHSEIQAWARTFDAENAYCAAGNDTFGGKNCQDFVVELCDFLNIDTDQLPYRQAQLAKAAGVAFGVLLGPVAAGLLVGATGYFLDIFESTSSSSASSDRSAGRGSLTSPPGVVPQGPVPPETRPADCTGEKQLVLHKAP